jgi:hypothetical protein
MLMRAFGTPVEPPVSKIEIGPLRVTLRHEAPHRPAAQPLVLEEAEFVEVRITFYGLARVEAPLLRPVEPEGRAALRVEVPGDHLADPGVEPVACGLAARGELLRGGGSLRGRGRQVVSSVVEGRRQSAEMR